MLLFYKSINIKRGEYRINDIFLEVLLQQKDEGMFLEEQLYIRGFSEV